MIKRITPFVVLVFVISASILFVHAYGISMMDPVYEILEDVSPLIVDQPSSFGWRWYNGSLQRQNGFGTWANVTSGTELNQLFNDYDIATLSDIESLAITVPDIVSALKDYFSGGASYESYGGNLNLPEQISDFRSVFGSYPYSYVRRYISTSESTTAANVTSFAGLLARIGQDMSYYLVSAADNSTLGANGAISPAPVNYSVSAVTRLGFLGLASRLSGTSGSALFDTFASGSGSVTVSNLLDAISTSNSNMINLLSSTSGTILMPDGVSVGINGRSSVAQTVNYGFQGLATILRGASSNGVGIEWMDYSDLSTSTSGYSYLFELNAAGFQHIQNLLAEYMYSHGTDLDIKERENMEGQAEQFVSDFTSPDGKGTMSQGNMSDMANVSASMGDNFSSSATVADIFTQLGSGNNYSFFSSDVLNDLEGNVPATVSLDDDGYVDFLSPHLQEFREGVGSLW